MPQPIRYDSVSVDLQNRFQSTQTIVASPALAAETVIATLNLANFGDIAILQGIRLHGWAAFTVGTSGTAVTLRIRQTNVSGAVVVSTGALTATAATLITAGATGVDALPGVAAYALTLQVTAGAAASTVSALHLGAILI